MYFKTEKLTINYEQFGTKKKSILILPGWGNTRDTFYSIINEFQNNFSIYIIDYPGFGESPIPKKVLMIEDYALLMKEFIKEKGIRNPIIIAHSFGGRITSLLIGKYQVKINKVILIDVAGIKRKKKLKVYLKEKLYKFLKKCTYLLPEIKQEEYRQKLLLLFGSTDYKSIPLCMQQTFQNIIKQDLRKYYKQIESETLIIWGEKDLDTPLKDGKYLEKIIKNSALIIYPNANHFSYLNYPILTNNIIKEFILKKKKVAKATLKDSND